MVVLVRLYGGLTVLFDPLEEITELFVGCLDQLRLELGVRDPEALQFCPIHVVTEETFQRLVNVEAVTVKLVSYLPENKNVSIQEYLNLNTLSCN